MIVGEVDGDEEERVEHPERDVAGGCWTSLPARCLRRSHALSGRGRRVGEAARG